LGKAKIIMRVLLIVGCLLFPFRSFAQPIVVGGIEANLSLRRENRITIADVEIKNVRDSTIYLVIGDPKYSSATSSDKIDIWLLNPYTRYLDYPNLKVDLISLEPEEKYQLSKSKESETIKQVVLSLEVVLTESINKGPYGKKVGRLFKRSIKKNEPEISVLYYASPLSNNHIKFSWPLY